MNRRDFLRAAGAGAITIVTPAWLEYLERVFYRRRFWQVGVDLSGGLVPVIGRPGKFHDPRTGRTLFMREFREEDRWDTVVIPAGPPDPDSPFHFVQGELRAFDRMDERQKAEILKQGVNVQEIINYYHERIRREFAEAEATEVYFQDVAAERRRRWK